MAITLSNILTPPGQLYSGYFPNRPVWGILATTNGSTPNSSNNFFYTFGRRNYMVPQSLDFMSGSSQANVLAGRFTPNNEVNASYYYSGNSSSQTTTNSFSPSSGFIGCCNISQTGADVYFDAMDTGYAAHYFTSNRSTVLVSSGVVIGEPNWNQTFDLVAYDGKIMKLPIGSVNTMVTTPNSNPDFFYVSPQIYAAYGSPSGASAGLGVASMTTDPNTAGSSTARRNRGMICHNRRTGKMAYLEATTTTGRYRLHIIDLRNKIGQSTTTQQILTWINEAVAAGTSRYNFYTLDFPSISNPSTQLSMEQARLVLCDDDTLWVGIFDKDDSSSSGTTDLFRCTNTTTYAPTLLSAISTTTAFGIGSGEQYGYRHMNSDDNSRVALYSPYYFYLVGINCHIVNTYTAVTSGTTTQWMSFSQQVSTGAFPIVAVGDQNFFVGNTSQNQDGGFGVAGMFFNTSTLRGQAISFSNNTAYMLPTVNQSTSYQSWVPIKVQPTQEWKPANE